MQLCSYFFPGATYNFQKSQEKHFCSDDFKTEMYITLGRCNMAFIEPMHCNKPNITFYIGFPKCEIFPMWDEG